ncbi:proline-rich protein 4-like [Salvia miltiorrhiza]|uniref:proline-rich protein 4-like n=1 Tax=Salvia miltiorrhiza TaxID=226208 RepID=UPI0025AD4083|nr:proline-rich protein 4-like [Salvia miltiorrhiza]
MRVHSLILGFVLLCLLSFCNADLKTFDIVGVAHCADCQLNNFNPTHAFSGLHVTIDCKLEKEMKRVGEGELDGDGKFKISLPKAMIGDVKKNCYAQLHSAAAAPCPAHGGLEATEIVLKSEMEEKITFSPAKTLRFSTALCTSKFLWPLFQYPPLPKADPWKKVWPKITIPPLKKHHWSLSPIYKPKPKPKPKVVKTLPPVPTYKPKPKPFPPPVPIYKPKPKSKPFLPPVPIYKPKPKPKPLPPPVPVYKPKPKLKPFLPPVPVYKSKPKPKPFLPPVPIYKPKPKPLPPPVPIYKPKPKPLSPSVPIYKPPTKPIPPIFHKPHPPSVPIYKPPVVKPIYKPLPPSVPIYKPLPPLFPFPPLYKKPCPPFSKIPPKSFFYHHKFRYFPKFPPFNPNP